MFRYGFASTTEQRVREKAIYEDYCNKEVAVIKNNGAVTIGKLPCMRSILGYSGMVALAKRCPKASNQILITAQMKVMLKKLILKILVRIIAVFQANLSLKNHIITSNKVNMRTTIVSVLIVIAVSFFIENNFANTLNHSHIKTYGTGFFYNRNGDFFTNRHVLEGCFPDSIRARTFDGSWHYVDVIAVDENADIAAATINKTVDAFASIRTLGDSGYVSVPEDTEDVFSAGFSDPIKNNFSIQIRWGQIQLWKDPNEPPFIQRMRMDTLPGSSGSPILDYGGLLLGITYAMSISPVNDTENLSAIGYGDKWSFFYNNNAIVKFANSENLNYFSWGNWERKDPMFIARHAMQITILLTCTK